MQGPARRREAEHGDHHDRRRRRPATAAIGELTVDRKAIAAMVATQGGKTFQTNMFSIWNTALDVAVMRLVSMPGSRFGEKARRMTGEMAEELATADRRSP